MTTWCSLYLPRAGDVPAALHEALSALGYQPFNPFGLIPGKTYSQAVRLFAAPARDGWTRVIGTPDPALLPPLSNLAPCLLLELDGADARITAYAGGAVTAPETAFPAHAACLESALNATASASDTNVSVGGVALDSLPADVQAMAQQVDLSQAGKLFSRMSATLAQKSGADPAAADLLRQPEWASAGGARIRAVLACLGLSATPDFVTLRDAYALHERRRRSPKAQLYPGDAETMAAVPDALDYTPVYAGKNG